VRGCLPLLVYLAEENIYKGIKQLLGETILSNLIIIINKKCGLTKYLNKVLMIKITESLFGVESGSSSFLFG